MVEREERRLYRLCCNGGTLVTLHYQFALMRFTSLVVFNFKKAYQCFRDKPSCPRAAYRKLITL